MKYSSLDNLAETLSFCNLKKGKIENFGHVLQHVSRWALKGICLVNGSLSPYQDNSPPPTTAPWTTPPANRPRDNCPRRQ